jgi:hypothetical protein
MNFKADCGDIFFAHFFGLSYSGDCSIKDVSQEHFLALNCLFDFFNIYDNILTENF